MNILIKGMEMPKEGDLLCINIYPDGKVCINLDLDCKQVATAIPVPPHGDLIDRYDLKNKEITIDYDERDDTFEDGLLFVTDLINNAPIIIPAEKET